MSPSLKQNHNITNDGHELRTICSITVIDPFILIKTWYYDGIPLPQSSTKISSVFRRNGEVDEKWKKLQHPVGFEPGSLNMDDVESRSNCKNAVFFFSAKQVASFQVKRKCRESVLASSFANLHLQRFEKPEISPKTLATIFYSRAFFKKANQVSL